MVTLVDNRLELLGINSPISNPISQKLYSAIKSSSQKRRRIRKIPYLTSLRITIGKEVRKDYLRQVRIAKKLFLRRRAFMRRRRKEIATGKKVLFHRVKTPYGSVVVSTDPKLAADSLRSLFSERDPKIIKEKILVRNILRDPHTPRHKIYARLLKWKGYEEEARIEEEKRRQTILAKGGAKAKLLKEQILREEAKKLLEQKKAAEAAQPKEEVDPFAKSAEEESDDELLEKHVEFKVFPNKIGSLMMKKGKHYKTQAILDKSDKILSSGFYKANPSLYTEISLRRYLPLLMTHQVSTSRVKKKVEIKHLTEDQSMGKVSKWVLESAEKTSRGTPDKRAVLLAQEIIASKHERNSYVKKKRDGLYAEIWPQLQWSASDAVDSNSTGTTKTIVKKSPATSSVTKKG
jgi:ribosomal protein S7